MTPAQSLSQSPHPASLALAIGALLVAAWSVWQMTSFQRRWKVLLKGEHGSLDDLLRAHLVERQETLDTLKEAKARIARLEDQMKSAKRYVGVVRYDAFDDVGGKQSFALAIYDEKGDGAVISSLVGRTDCRVYGKALLKGRAESPLSEEESRALEAAADSSRPLIST